MFELTAIHIAGGIIMILVSIGIMFSILLQESKRGGGLEALSQASSSYYSQNQGRTKDAILHKVTKVLAYIFFIVTIVVSLATVYLT